MREAQSSCKVGTAFIFGFRVSCVRRVCFLTTRVASRPYASWLRKGSPAHHPPPCAPPRDVQREMTRGGGNKAIANRKSEPLQTWKTPRANVSDFLQPRAPRRMRAYAQIR